MLKHFIYRKKEENFNSKDFLKRALDKLGDKWQRSLTIAGVVNPIRTSDWLGLFHDKDLDAEIFNIYSKHIIEYQKLYPDCKIQNDEGYTLLRYKEGEFYGRHCDDVTQQHRVVSGLIYLNDDYEGGELNFPDFDLKIKPEAGAVVLFPSNFVYVHESLPVTKGTKYCVTTWFV